MKSDRAAGTVLTIDVTETPLPYDGWATGGTHALGLAAAVELSRALGGMPQRLVVIGVEVDWLSAGSELSAPVRDAIQPAAVAALRALTDET
jgi:hydrogenase maturation protease